MGLLDRIRGRAPATQELAIGAPANPAGQYREVLANLQWLDADDEALNELAALRTAARLKPKDEAATAHAAFLRCAEEALADDVLSTAEEDRLLALGEALGVDINDAAFEETKSRLVIARVNDGRLPTIDVAILLKPGERAHASCAAALLKEVALKEFRAGSTGVSFRIAKGVSYRVGRTRGQMVTIGSKVVVEDTGALYLTSARAVFRGDKKLLEFDYRKLVDVRVYGDGVGLAVSNRQATSTFRVAGVSPDALAAILNAAAQRVL
jgi:hypothetical protein